MCERPGLSHSLPEFSVRYRTRSTKQARAGRTSHAASWVSVAGDACGSAPTGTPRRALMSRLSRRTCLTESHMYLGGILGTILLIALIVFVLRRV